MRRISNWLLGLVAFLSVVSFLPIVEAVITQVPTNTWGPAGSSTVMSSARAGAATVLLQDGRMLVVGGDNGSGAVTSADIFDTSGLFSPAAAMNTARSKHTATLLQDGTVLVAGGLSGGTATSSAEIYNPTTGTWTVTSGPMNQARSGHTATLLGDGTVLIAGGDYAGVPQSSLEIYNPTTGTFSLATGSLSSARELHAAALLQNGEVIILGGFDGTQALATTDIYDPSSGTVSAGPPMSTARQNFTATTELDGRVLAAGGNNGATNGSQDLGTAEAYDPSSGTFSITGNLVIARQGHQAFLLPHNGAILITGGTAPVNGNETSIANAELYYPLETGQDASPYWNGTFVATGSMAAARSNATGGSPSNGTPQSTNDGFLLVAGGRDAADTALSSSEIYGFAWIKTDATDYAPGTTVNITGGGFQPGETVTLHFQESPYYDSHPDLTAVVQADGTFSNSQFAPDVHDIDIRFYLTAAGAASGALAQTTFTDNKTLTVSFTGSGSGSVTSNPSGITCTDTSGVPSGTCTESVANTATITLTATPTSPSSIGTWSVSSGTVNSGCTAGSTTCTLTLSNSNATVTVSFKPGPVNAATSTFVATPTSVIANGTSSTTLTVTLKDSGGNPVGSKSVSLSQGSGHSTISPASATTNAAGVATFTATDTTVEVVTYTAQDTTDSTTVTQTSTVSYTVGPVSASASTVVASPTSVAADGSTTSTITVTLFDSFNHPVSGKAVSLAQGTGHSTISPASATTNASGVATFTVKNTKAETDTYAATDTTDSITITQTAQVTFTAGSVSPSVSTVSANPASVPADGATASTITVTLLDANSNPVSGKTVSLSAGSGSSTITTLSGTTNASGQATFSVKDFVVESVTYSAKDATDTISITQTANVNFTVGPVSATTSTVSANPTSVVADGVTTSTVIVTLLDASSRPVSGKTVTLTAGSGSSTITTVNGTTNASGQATFSVKDTKAETVAYAGKDATDNITVTQTAQVTFTAGTPTAGNSTVTANPPSVTADGSSTSTITVTLEDGHNNLVSGKTVTLQGTGGSAITTVSGTTNASGVATFTVKNTKAETDTYTATDTSDNVVVTQTAQVTFMPGALTKFVVATISSPQTAGTAFNVTITAEDANGNTVTSYSGGSDKVMISSTGTIQGGSFTSNSFNNGVLTQGVTITNTGNFTITAIGIGQNSGVTGTSNSFTVNAGAAAHLSVSAPGSATAGTPINFTVTALDAFNNTATGYLGTLRFSSTDGQAVLPANYQFGPGDNGVHTFSATLETAGSRTVTATDTANASITGTSGSITVSAGSPASVTATAGTPQSTTIGTAFPTNLAATVKDAYGNPVNGVVVTFAAPGSGASGSFTGGVNTATTNSSGVATAAVFTANGIAGSYNVTASVSGVASPASFSLTNNNPVPTLTSISPTSGLVTQTLNVMLTGSNFISGVTTVSFGADITVNSVTVNSATQITAIITIPSTATLGTHTVSATNPAPGGGAASLVSVFNVIGTPPQITSGASATFTAGVFGSFTVMTSGNPTPSLSESGNLPGGLTFKDNGNGTATLSGTATLAKSYPIVITAQNGVSPNATQNFTLTVNPGSLASITLNPANPTIPAGGSQAFTTTGFDQFANSLGDVTAATTFTVTNGTCVGNVCSSTLAGVQNVTGNDSGIMGSDSLTVVPGPIMHLALSPATATIAAGGSQTYSAIGVDAYGNPTGNVTNSTTITITPDGACSGATCSTNVADVTGSSHTVTGTYSLTGAQGLASLTVTPGTATQLQLLVPGETAAPGTTTGKTGTPNTDYVNGQFIATVNAVDQYWNVVTTVNDTVHITSNDAKALLPIDAPLVSGTGTFAVTLESVSYNPATTTLTASDVTTPATNSSSSALIPVIVVYTAAISPADWATGQTATYTLTINNAPAPNANNLASIEVAVPSADQGTIGNVTVTATEPGGAAANWSYDTSLMPAMIRFFENTANDAVSPGGAITISFTATSSAQVNSSVVSEVWNTTAYSDSTSKNPLPLALPEPTVQIGAAPKITSASSTNAFTYGTSGTAFTVTTTGFPTPNLAESGTFPAWATFTDNHDGTATISGTPSAAGSSTFTITAHNGYGNDATQSFTLMVNKATVMPSITASDKVYDGTATATVSCTLSGVLSQDSMNVSCSPASASFSQAGAGNNLTVTATGITSNGTAAGDYQLSTTTATTTANILQKMLTPSITAANKTYDGTTNASVTCNLSGVISGDSVSCSTASANFASANAGTWTVTATGITMSGASVANYQLSSTTATTTATITQATPAINVVGGTFTYDGNPHGASATAIGVGGTMVSGTFAFTYTPPGDITVPANAGAYNVTAAFTSVDPNYKNAVGMGLLTINQALASVTAANASRPYGQANPAFTGTLTGFVPADGITATYASAATISTPVGIYGPATPGAIVPTLVDPNNKVSNYIVTSTNGTLTITAVPLLVVSPDNTRAFGVADSPLTPMLVGLVAGDTAPTVGNPKCQSMATSTSAPGTYAIVCSGVTSTNYVVTYVNGTLTITDPLSSIAVTPNPATLTYGGSTTFSAQGTFASSASRMLSNTGGNAYELHDLGTARTGAASAEAQGRLYAIGGTVSGTPSNTVEVYDPSSDAWSPVANLNYARTSARAASVGGRIYAFGGCSDAACTSPVSTPEVYDPASNTWNTISSTGFTPRSSMAVGVVSDQVYVAGGNDSSGNPLATVEIYNPGTNTWSSAPSLKTTLGPASGGVVNGNFYVVGIVSGNAEVEEFSSGNWSTVNTGIQPLSDVGVAVLNNVIYVIDGATIHAYDPIANAWTNKNSLNTARVQPEPVTISNLIYMAGNTASGATDPNSLEAFASGEAAWSSSDATIASIDQTAKATALKVGNTNITATSIQSPTVSGSSALTVNPAQLTITASTNTKTYDATTSAAAIPTISGLQFTDTVTGVTESYTDKNAGTGKTLVVNPGYTINDGNNGNNYTVQLVSNTTGVILQAPLTISAVTNTKTYDSTTSAAAVPTTSGLQGSDTVTGLTESYTDKNAGTGKTLSVNPGYTINDGNGGKNYIVTTANNTSGVILQAPLTISAVTNTKTYDATTSAAAIPTTSGLQGSDSVSGLTESYTDKNAGTGKTLVVNPGYTVIDGNGGKNYIVTTINNTSGVILQAPLTISATGINKQYDGTTAGTVTLSDNHINSDTVVDTYTSATFSDKSAGNGKLITVTGISISGADAPNYTFNTTATTTANITQRPLLISATGINKIYDSTVNATVTLSDNRVSGDVFNDTYTSASFLGPNVGVGKTVNVTGISIVGTDAPNYTYNTTATTTANISPAPLTVTASSGSMTYGSSPFVVMPMYFGFLGMDGPSSLTSGIPVCSPVLSSTSAPGSYPTSCTAPTPNGNYALSFVGGNVMVNQASSATSVASSVNPSTFMQMVTFTATVADSSQGSSGTPTGTVTFNDTYNGNTTALCTTSLLVANNGQVTCSTSSLGDQYQNNITVSYSGDTNFLPSSTASPLGQNVNPAPVVTLNPMYVSFGNQNVNTSSRPAPITLTNIGDAALNINTGGISISGSNATEFGETTTCGSTIAPNGQCTISVTFAPSDTGVATASLQISDNDDDGGAGTSQIVSLTGAGLSTIVGTSLYTDGLFATGSSCGSITMSGGSTADSFNSALGYGSSHQLSGGNVGTNGNVTLNGSTTTIYGSAAVDMVTAGSCSKSSMTGLTTSGKAQVTGGLVALNGPISYPTLPTPKPAPPTASQSISGSCPAGMTGCSKGAQSKSVILAPGQYGNVTISGGTTAHVGQGNYVFNSLSLSGNSILYVDSGPVAINLAGASMGGSSPALDLSGGSIENPSGIPSNLQFSYPGSRGVNLSGGSGAYATMYAPNALVNMSGGSDFFGSIIASTITNSGGTAMHYDTGLPNIPAGNYIWFSAVVNNVNNLGNSQVKLYLTNSAINFTANGTAYNVPVPNAVITFNSASAAKPTTTYDLNNSRWSTSVPASGLTGNTFVTGVAWRVPSNFPGGIQNVSWSTAFSTDTPGVTLQWQWGAAIYTSFSTVYATTSPANNDVLQVNPEDGTADPYSPDPAGTPEAYKSSVTFGGTGGGLTNYTGFMSTGAGVVPTIAPMSVSPSSLDFGSQTQGTTSTQMTAVLTNNDSASHTIESISMSGTNAGDFIQTNNCIPSGMTSATLASGGSCTFTVTFAPSDIGTRTAKVVITSDANNSPQSVYLTGMGH